MERKRERESVYVNFKKFLYYLYFIVNVKSKKTRDDVICTIIFVLD
jgi:hypothetical protein